MAHKTKYHTTVKHDGLGEQKVITGTDQFAVQQRAERQLRVWEEKWQRLQARQAQQSKRDIAANTTREALNLLQNLENILKQCVNKEHAINWDFLKDFSEFPEPQIFEPKRTDAKYVPKPGCLGQFVESIKQKAIDDADALFQKDYVSWKKWVSKKEAFLNEQKERNDDVERKKQEYLQKTPSAVVSYCEMVLENTSYPDTFPQKYDIEYNPENGVLIIEYQLPSLEDIPTLKEVKYVQTRDELKDVHITEAEKLRLYDSLIYQITLGSIYQIFKSDVITAITSVVFNGWVETIDPTNGQQITPCIVTVQANRDEFQKINFNLVDPRACFKSLKGISGARISNLTPVAPVLSLNREDRRFVDAYGVMENLGSIENLAAMDWKDFENLVRELFEKEFAQGGGEVKVTQASRDGGVDAVAFDPDPIRGGKIIIQAKRYTNIVDVSAVRDLYGTVLSEGATKGILITTSNYGSDSYEFAKRKPLTLLSGNNLLHLLEKHGYKARIDLREAKKTLAEQEKERGK